WFNIKQIQTTNAGAFECVGVYGGKLYLTGCDKISDVGSGVTCISVVVGEAWIDSQKVTSSGTGVENAGWISQTGGTLWANIGQFEDGGSMTNGIICNSATADMHIRGNFAKVNNGTAIIHLAGTNHTSINVIDTSTGSTTNAKPVVVSAVGMCLGGTCLLAPASTPTIWASSAQTVSLFNFCSGNSNVSANITLHNSPITRGTQPLNDSTRQCCSSSAALARLYSKRVHFLPFQAFLQPFSSFFRGYTRISHSRP